MRNLTFFSSKKKRKNTFFEKKKDCINIELHLFTCSVLSHHSAVFRPALSLPVSRNNVRVASSRYRQNSPPTNENARPCNNFLANVSLVTCQLITAKNVEAKSCG